MFMKQTKKYYFKMPHYIAFNLAMYTNHIFKSLCKSDGNLTLFIFIINYKEKNVFFKKWIYVGLVGDHRHKFMV